jgi:fido (protein-threonine AMPylation protein)
MTALRDALSTSRLKSSGPKSRADGVSEDDRHSEAEEPSQVADPDERARVEYVLWRLNWTHPFVDGNGRTSRAVSYFVLCMKSGNVLPGKKTIPEHIADNKPPYYKALEAADKANAEGSLDLSDLESLLSAALATQLADYHRQATGQT